MPLSELCARRWGCRAPPHTHTHAHHTHTHTHTDFECHRQGQSPNRKPATRKHTTCTCTQKHAHTRASHAAATVAVSRSLQPTPLHNAYSLHRTACAGAYSCSTEPTAAPVYSTYSCVCSANSTAPTAAFAALTAAPSWQSCALGIGLLCLAAGGAAAVSGHGPRGNYGLAARHDGPDHLGLWSNQAAGLWWKASHVWALWVSAQQRFFLRLSLRFHDSDGVLSLPCHPLTRLRPLPFIIFHRLSPRFCCNREPTRVHFLARERCL